MAIIPKRFHEIMYRGHTNMHVLLTLFNDYQSDATHIFHPYASLYIKITYSHLHDYKC